jgi:deazaflavin-dependent oxidoreductase (nitroreductase family)
VSCAATAYAHAMPDGPEDFNAEMTRRFYETAGRVGGMFENVPLILLHHVGGRTGTSYVSPLAAMQDGDRYVIAASKAGAPVNPAWFHNLRSHPETRIEAGVNGRVETIEVVAEALEGDERERLWGELSRREPRFAEYQAKTDRIIPVVVLTPTGRA